MPGERHVKDRVVAGNRTLAHVEVPGFVSPYAAAIVLLAATLVGCGGGEASPSTSSLAAPARTRAITIAPAELPACALLFARLQRVTLAIRTSSELIAHSQNRRQLTHRIAVEEVQLRRSARLVAGGPIPAALVPADRELASALRDFSRDFARARAPAARGDFQAASAELTDAPVVKRIVRASKTIEDACK